MGVKHVLGTGTYLGLPSMIGRKKDRVWKRINSWRGRSLSKAGKDVMIKLVLQVIPSHVMSIYLLPDATIKDIERMMNSFWWGGGSQNKGIKWLAWDRMTIPKGRGGLGFRDLHAFNLAMIAKQGWNIMTQPHTLVAKIYKARYFPNSSFFESKIGHNPSYAWRGIWKARHILMNGCRWSVGNGNNIKVMNEPWIRGEEGAWVPSPQSQGVYDLTVKDLMLPGVKMWDKEKIDSIFPLHTAYCILNTPLLDWIEEDKLLWMDSLHGIYSVKSGYNLLMHGTGQQNDANYQEDWQSLWKINAPPKAKHLLWRICKGCLPTRSRLQERCVPCPLTCPLCNHELEDDWHVLFSCEDSVLALQTAGLHHVLVPRLQQQQQNVSTVILELCARVDANTAGLFAMLVWVIWQNRNNRVWNDANEPGRFLGVAARRLWEEWASVQQVQSAVQPVNQLQQQIVWQKPPQGWLKCNADAAFHKDLNKTSVGWCLRDHMRRFVMAGTTWKIRKYHESSIVLEKYNDD